MDFITQNNKYFSIFGLSALNLRGKIYLLKIIFIWHHEKLVLRKGAFRWVPTKGPLGPTSEVHGVFSNADYCPSIGEQPGAIATARNVLGVS